MYYVESLILIRRREIISKINVLFWIIKYKVKVIMLAKRAIAEVPLKEPTYDIAQVPR